MIGVRFRLGVGVKEWLRTCLYHFHISAIVSIPKHDPVLGTYTTSRTPNARITAAVITVLASRSSGCGTPRVRNCSSVTPTNASTASHTPWGCKAGHRSGRAKSKAGRTHLGLGLGLGLLVLGLVLGLLLTLGLGLVLGLLLTLGLALMLGSGLGLRLGSTTNVGSLVKRTLAADMRKQQVSPPMATTVPESSLLRNHAVCVCVCACVCECVCERECV